MIVLVSARVASIHGFMLYTTLPSAPCVPTCDLTYRGRCCQWVVDSMVDREGLCGVPTNFARGTSP